MNALLAWLDHRTGIKGLLHEALYERIPGGARWRYVWGSTLVFTFTVQMITGIILWSAYSPNAYGAWESVYNIQHHMTMGWMVRGIHHFAAQAMVVLMAIHLMQVVIDGAYKAPREVNFWLGLVLMQIVLGFSLTGYLLPWDQKGYYATRVATEIAGATPVVGAQVQKLAVGGDQYGHATLMRFFALHTGVLPASLVAFLALHIYVFRRHGITVPDPDRAPTTTFWPDQVLKDAVACLAVLVTVMVLAFQFGAELSAPANAAEAYSAARPEWYYLFLFRFLKFEAVEHFGLAFGAIYVPGVLMTILALMPFIAKVKGGHKFNVAFLLLVSLGAIGLTVLAMNEDKNNVSHQAAVKEALADGERLVELSDAYGIPVGGANELARNDPKLQGPRIFAKTCAACHRYDGHDGRGSPILVKDSTGKESTAEATATDLGKYGTREWSKAVITDYDKLFTPLRNAEWHKELVAKPEVDGLNLDKSDMAGWVKENRETLLKPENAEDLKALVEFLTSQADRPGETYDAKLVERGAKVFEDGTLASGSLTVSCTGCHAPIPAAAPGAQVVFDPKVEPNGFPTLAGYGSEAWLKHFIANPGHALHYGAKNQMPAYAQQFSDHQFNMLVRWMTGNYYKPKKEHGE